MHFAQHNHSERLQHQEGHNDRMNLHFEFRIISLIMGGFIMAVTKFDNEICAGCFRNQGVFIPYTNKAFVGLSRPANNSCLSGSMSQCFKIFC